MKFTEIYGNPAKIHNKQVYSVSARNLILSVPNEWEILQICVAENNFLGTWFLNGKTTERLSKDAAKKIPHHRCESTCYMFACSLFILKSFPCFPSGFPTETSVAGPWCQCYRGGCNYGQGQTFRCGSKIQLLTSTSKASHKGFVTRALLCHFSRCSILR